MDINGSSADADEATSEDAESSKKLASQLRETSVSRVKTLRDTA